MDGRPGAAGTLRGHGLKGALSSNLNYSETRTHFAAFGTSRGRKGAVRFGIEDHSIAVVAQFR